MTTQIDRVTQAPDASDVPSALSALRSGSPVLLVSRERPEVADVLLPAALAEADQVAWIVRHTSGLLSTPMPADRADALHLPPMVGSVQAPDTAAYAVSVDAADGIGTGISARDRARTARVLADPDSSPDALCRPGHVLPVRVGTAASSTPHGAAVALCREAGLPPVAVTAGLVAGEDNAVTTNGPGQWEVVALADRHGLPLVDVDDVWFTSHGAEAAPGASLTARPCGTLTTAHGAVSVVEYRDELVGVEHLAIHRDLAAAPPRLAVHIGCAVGDLFGSSACACRARLDDAVAATARYGGLLVYLRAGTDPGLCGRASGAASAPTPLVATVLADLGVSRIQLDRDAPISPRYLMTRGIEVVAA
ncbi:MULTISPECIES: 3,4-dihydroxy-2-butanone-4-phosphate synthase [Prauserella salsuginis group]|uniref:3,4-dihydroxy-2-butanone-4-phosphate synthase n=2 Tax=Prauserella salsuginis group TaxID=2893672 RepID=A0A839XQN0_9PSEU|nr:MULTISPECIES: 3,4-dihydroxy-2-butanone-4-phosphate synthase [Prauserella salsuginis group]MBB3664259.1 3,4-dihydroxy 2-butanone 4-phosphate synthase/GTP cyclohydrolase II [Prauserella sediminis]MCR3721705.1 3,4-dihydroxy 2-butanone 4-phosphate synthase / GTP cyclohydrolase II [Prauserella flava]MCR3734397.1 3,4-dihydroxy 2-butanone 4-phosphate synthase / GTP cyclohydrolase II [Prauserella salsuginis]